MFKLLAKPIFIAAGLVLGFSSAAVAMPSNTVNIATGCAVPPTGVVNTTQTATIRQDLAFGRGNCAVGVQTRVGGGGVGILTTMTQESSQGNKLTTVFAESTAVIDLGVPANFTPGDVIPVSINPHLNGTAFASLQAFSLFGRSANATLTASVRISGPGGISASSATATVTTGATNNQGTTLTASSNSLPNSLFATTVLNPLQPVEVRFRFDVRLETFVFNNAAFAVAGVDAFNSLSFALSGPALILPDGFTANSVSGQIVDNVFVGQGTNTNGSQVPEPGALALFGIGLVGLGAIRRRRERV